MKEISEHDLTGYLLGALEPAEELAVKEALDENPELRARVAVMEEKLSQMPDRFVEIDPPTDLAEKTMNTLSIVESSLRSEGVSDQQAIRTSNAGKRERRYKSASYAGREFAGSGSSWSVMDLIVGAVVCFVVAAVLLPSISNSRFQANLLKCEDNLRQIGHSMASIADSHEGRLVVPEAETTGQWNASLFVEKMFASELANDTAQFICPSDPAREKTAEICKQAWSEIHLALPEQQVPSPAELIKKGDADASIPKPFLTTDPVAGRLHTLRQSEAACGSYGFPAPQVASTASRLKSGLTSAPLQSGLPGSGRFPGNEFEAIRVPSSPYLVLCADAACFENPGYRSGNHGGRGQNVLLGDLSVDYITESACLATGDHIYTNNQGQIQPGVSPGDNLIFRGVLQVIGNR